MRTLLPALPLLAAACVLPPFDGHATSAWLAFDQTIPPTAHSPREALRSFATAALNYGCDAEPGGLGAGSGDPRGASAIAAGDVVNVYCAEGRVSLRISPDSDRRVTVGCPQPTTRERCEALMRKIATATANVDAGAPHPSPLDKPGPPAKSP